MSLPIRFLALGAAVVATSSSAFAARAAEPYVGVAVGETHTNVDNSLLDGHDSSYKIVGGWRWRHLALEAAYMDLGTIRQRPGGPSVSNFKLEQEGYTAAGVLVLDVRNLDLYAKAGLVLSESERIVVFPTQRIAQTDHDWDVFLGAGVAVQFDRLALRFEYERFNISNGVDLDRPETFSVGMIFQFGSRRSAADADAR